MRLGGRFRKFDRVSWVKGLKKVNTVITVFNRENGKYRKTEKIASTRLTA